ncbi:MAG: dihydrolipoamide acetyltransferase family protein [Chitinophagales bacterium]
MAQMEIVMPKMGESITEATIIKWSKQVGEHIGFEETLLEIATDKVDSEIPSPVEGILLKILFEEDTIVPVGEVIAIVATEGEQNEKEELKSKEPKNKGIDEMNFKARNELKEIVRKEQENLSKGDKFYSPLVKKIAAEENISWAELDEIKGSGAKGRVSKSDLLTYIENREEAVSKPNYKSIDNTSTENVEIIEMDRMRQLIADHMVRSVQTSPHVTSFLEIDVTNIVNWRNEHKQAYEKKHGQKLTFTPIFLEAVAKAIVDFPLINSSVEGKNILVKKNINIGMATALPSGNLIVPVIKNADQYNLAELVSKVNELANNARKNKLKPEDTQNGTFTLTNVGTFGNTMGTPIINQPQAAILSTGAINKKPAVLETEYGDIVAIRHRMFLSLSYDHRIIDGKLGGSFLRRIGDYLEAFDKRQEI